MYVSVSKVLSPRNDGGKNNLSERLDFLLIKKNQTQFLVEKVFIDFHN